MRFEEQYQVSCPDRRWTRFVSM